MKDEWLEFSKSFTTYFIEGTFVIQKQEMRATNATAIPYLICPSVKLYNRTSIKISLF